MFKKITRTVFIISLVSLFNDFSSEMLYPVLPLYLAQIGYGGLFIGIIEGIAELIAGFTKIYTGSLSDKMQRRLPFVNWGYALSVLSRPLMIAGQSVGWVLSGRSIDKLGKGIRTASRDALLADESDESNRAEVFGFHRSMDTLGAILGPTVALIYLYFYPEDYKSVFLIAFLPGVVAVIFTFFIKEKKKENIVLQKKDFSLVKNFSFYKTAPKQYLVFLAIILSFTMFNSSDMFLLLRAKQSGISETHVLMLYIFFNLVFALSAFPIGKMADKMNKHSVLFVGLLLYAFTYLLMFFSAHIVALVVAFMCYGLFYSFTQGIIKVLLLEKVSKEMKSSAIGFYEGLNSILLLLSNAIAGLVWYRFGADAMLLGTAFGTVAVALIFILAEKKKNLINV